MNGIWNSKLFSKRGQCEEGFLVINLAKKMKDYAEENQIFLHGFSKDIMGVGHWNIAGHKIASQIISEEMCESLAR